MVLSFRTKAQILIAYVSLCIIAEIFYRHPLFTKSLSIEQHMYNTASPLFISFLKLITKLGTQVTMLPIFIIFLIFIPLNKTYTYLCILVYANYIDNILKLIYGSPRPFWIDPSIFRICDGGFGNPSGHSFTSMSIYLSIWHIITDHKYFNSTTLGKLSKVLLFFCFIGLTILIMVSRLYLSVHSINQVLHGALLGIALYVFYFHVLELHKSSPELFKQHIYSKRNIIIHTAVYVTCIVGVVVVYLCKHNNKIDYVDTIERLCPLLLPYRKFNNDGLFIALTLMFGMGAYYGLVFLYYKLNKQFINKDNVVIKWNEVSDKKKKVYLVCAVWPFLVFMILFKVVQKDGSVFTFFVFGVGLPYFVTGFLLFGGYVYICIACQFANKEFYTLPEITRRPTDVVDYSKPGENKGSVTIEIQFNQ